MQNWRKEYKLVGFEWFRVHNGWKAAMTAFISQHIIKLGGNNKEQKSSVLMVMNNPLGQMVGREMPLENCTHIKTQNEQIGCNCSFISFSDYPTVLNSRPQNLKNHVTPPETGHVTAAEDNLCQRLMDWSQLWGKNSDRGPRCVITAPVKQQSTVLTGSSALTHSISHCQVQSIP